MQHLPSKAQPFMETLRDFAGRLIILAVKGVKCLRKNGLRYTLNRGWEILFRHPDFSFEACCDKAELDRQRQDNLQSIKISVAVPVFNTPVELLREMIYSVRNQTYRNWELCLADGSDSDHSETSDFCAKYAAEDVRIVYQKLLENKGISGNSNAALSMATGEYIALLDHDDLLHPAALYEVTRKIIDLNADFVFTDEAVFYKTHKDAFLPHFKPDFWPDTFRANNYLCHLSVFRRSLLERSGGFRAECDGSQDFDLFLRLTEQARRIVHVPKILYYWRAHEGSVALSLKEKPYVFAAAKKAISGHLMRVGLKGTVEDSAAKSTYRIRYEITDPGLVSIVVVGCGNLLQTTKLLESIHHQTTYRTFEIVVVDSDADGRYAQEIARRWADTVYVRCDRTDNYAARANMGCRRISGEYVVILDASTEVITPEWIEEMMMFSQRKEVGAVGCMLYNTNETICHAGVIIGINGLFGFAFRNQKRGIVGYMGRAAYAQNLSAVSGGCIMMRREIWDRLGGLDETYEGHAADVDFCMRVRQAGMLVVWTPFAELYQKTRVGDVSEKDELHFKDRWGNELACGDPCYNPGFSCARGDFFFAEKYFK